MTESTSCPACAAPVAAADRYCESCGAELHPLVIATAQEPGGTPAVVVVVCDGVSSTPRAADASQAAAEAAAALLIDAVRSGAGAEEATTAAAARAAAAVTALAAAGTAPSCTLVSAVVTEKLVTVGWVGDSRAYWLAAHPVKLTKDDNVAGALVVAAQLR